MSSVIYVAVDRYRGSDRLRVTTGHLRESLAIPVKLRKSCGNDSPQIIGLRFVRYNRLQAPVGS